MSDLESLVLMLRMQAEVGLGMLAPPGQEAKQELELARHFIDMLSVLSEKTKGNLTLEEQRTLENSLTELRFRYVQADDAQKAGNG